jgi:hypothetical protein
MIDLFGLGVIQACLSIGGGQPCTLGAISCIAGPHQCPCPQACATTGACQHGLRNAAGSQYEANMTAYWQQQRGADVIDLPADAVRVVRDVLLLPGVPREADSDGGECD